ncbi:MAG TPA: tRNA pseudouridine(55) synthase TruB [Bacteroidales bacterium]|nr:tRNA pseudouridine(55) synthase TruB [Bacteroidales bacterium]HRZ77471.1 tRNA pseudouridine(55) synthase TruB [Bacteroidales bacterium]
MLRDPSTYDFPGGELLLFDKAPGWTSFDVVNYLRGALSRHCGVKRLKVGHAGTLDPMASGLLLVCTGRFTKRIDEFQGMDKTYTGTLRLGQTTPSFDAETPPDAEYPWEHLTEARLHDAAKAFEGPQQQVPPLYSAIHIQGQRAYTLARKGGDDVPVLEPRPVHIHAFELSRIALPEVDFFLRCSKGTYVRSLARDLGIALESGAYLSALRRTAIGPYTVDKAMDVKDFLSRFAH